MPAAEARARSEAAAAARKLVHTDPHALAQQWVAAAYGDGIKGAGPASIKAFQTAPGHAAVTDALRRGHWAAPPPACLQHQSNGWVRAAAFKEHELVCSKALSFCRASTAFLTNAVPPFLAVPQQQALRNCWSARHVYGPWLGEADNTLLDQKRFADKVRCGAVRSRLQAGRPAQGWLQVGTVRACPSSISLSRICCRIAGHLTLWLSLSLCLSPSLSLSLSSPPT
eukprot:SAG22_NODE_4010_length_1424_cov_1.311698_1_plen_225_part_10